MRFPRAMIVILSLVVIAAFFLPYFMTEGDRKVTAEEVGEERLLSDVNITGNELSKPSLFMYAKMYFTGKQYLYQSEDVSIVQGIMVCLIPFFAILLLIFGLTGVPIPSLIFSMFLAGSAYLLQKDFEFRGLIPNPEFKLGIAFYMIYACAVLIFFFSICDIVAKHNRKKV